MSEVNRFLTSSNYFRWSSNQRKAFVFEVNSRSLTVMCTKSGIKPDSPLARSRKDLTPVSRKFRQSHFSHGVGFDSFGTDNQSSKWYFSPNLKLLLREHYI